MNRLQQVFGHNKAYIGYLTVGHQGLSRCMEAASALVEGGVNVLELGVPFSDPVADGPVIQKAMHDALQRGTRLQDVIQLASQLRQRYPKLPIILFNYYNVLLQQPDVLVDAQKAGVDGVLVVDLPYEEGENLLNQCHESCLAPIFVVTPDTDSLRLQAIDQRARGFIYYACRKGTTGIKKGLPDDFAQRVSQIQNDCQLPVAAGFGIASRESASQVVQYADGFVVGSRFVKAIDEGLDYSALAQLAQSLQPSRGL